MALSLDENEKQVMMRGCSSNFPLPLTQKDAQSAQSLAGLVFRYNIEAPPSNIPSVRNVCFRTTMAGDILHHVLWWTELTPYQVFEHGFQAVPEEYYYNLYDHVSNDQALPPEAKTYNKHHAFVSTTISSSWRPNLNMRPGQTTISMYRYEIYAPGGIWVAETLGDRYPNRPDEVAFIGGIRPQYIRSAQMYTITTSRDRNAIVQRTDDILIVNPNFNPESGRQLKLFKPIMDHQTSKSPLNIQFYRSQSERENKVSYQVTNWYAKNVAKTNIYVTAAFRSSIINEAYIFMGNEYVRLDYAPAASNDEIINGPSLICDGFPSLKGTVFVENGIDCAFACHSGNEAFIFSGEFCALIDYAPGTTNDKILDGPMLVADMFPFFKDTVFEYTVDAAFESTVVGEAYLFKGDKYARINYSTKSLIGGSIGSCFRSWRNTVFQSGIEAALASHLKDEAYIFKGDQYARINFAPGSSDDYIFGGGPAAISRYWTALPTIIPRKNRGLDGIIL